MIDPDLIRLLSDSPYHHSYREEDIYRTIIPAIRNNQYLMTDDGDRLTGFMSWAFMLPEQAEGYVNKTRRLRAADFSRKQGDLWFIDFIAPYGNVRQIIREFQAEFQPRYPDIKFGKMFRRAKGYDARVIVRTK